MTVWFTSDLHIGHKFVAMLRAKDVGIAGDHDEAVSEQFVEWHDNMLAENWDRVVKKDDVVWVLGDLSAGGTGGSLKNALHWVDDRPGTKYLVAGNHCPVHPMHRDAHTHAKLYKHIFAAPPMAFARRKVALPDGTYQSVMLSHFPYSGDHSYGDRFEQYRLRDMGSPGDPGTPVIHGHTHTAEKTSRSNVGTLQVHIGLDAWNYTPVSLETVAELL